LEMPLSSIAGAVMCIFRDKIGFNLVIWAATLYPYGP